MKCYSHGFLPVCFSLSAQGHGIPRMLTEEIMEDASCLKAEGKGCKVGSDVPNIYIQYPSVRYYSLNNYQIKIIKKKGINSQWPYLDNRIIPRPGVAGLSNTRGTIF